MGHYPSESLVRVQKSVVQLHADEEPKTLWHWQYLDERGVLMDSSGRARDGLASLAAVRKIVKKKYRKVRVELMVGEDDPDFGLW